MYPILLVLLSALLFGASTPACKALLQELDPVQLAGWLYLGAAIGAAPGMLRRGQRQRVKRLDRKNKLRLLGAVSFGGVLGPIALLLGLRLASAASVSLWLNLELVATALLGYFFFRDHLGRFGWLGVVGVLIAGIILSLGGGASGVAAGLLVALACLFWGLDNHLTALIDGITPLQSTFYKGMVAGSFNLGLAFLLGASWPAPELALGGIMVGILAYGVSIALYITAAQQLGATRAQLVFASAPFFGAGLSAAVLGEPLGMAHLVAGVILVISLILLFWISMSTSTPMKPWPTNTLTAMTTDTTPTSIQEWHPGNDTPTLMTMSPRPTATPTGPIFTTATRTGSRRSPEGSGDDAFSGRFLAGRSVGWEGRSP